VLARHPHDLVPVIANERVIGGAGFREAKQAPQSEWAATPLSRIATPIAEIPTADRRLEIEAALERMQKAGSSRLIVTDGERLAGILTLKDLAQHLRFRSAVAAAKADAGSRGRPPINPVSHQDSAEAARIDR
jgi:predicted transcriptional regulator